MGKVSVLIRRNENVFQILIVEDDKELSQLFQKVFEKNGYQVKSASDGAQALEVLDKEYIDPVSYTHLQLIRPMVYLSSRKLVSSLQRIR